VDPTYKPMWDLPGGVVEEEESPHAACRREVAEETGLDRYRAAACGRLGALAAERPEGLILIYDGGVLAPGEVAAITLPDGELAGYEFVEPAAVAVRVSRCWLAGSPRAWTRSRPAPRSRWKTAAR